MALIGRKLLFQRPHVLSAARVRETCFSLTFIAVPRCQTWLKASTGNYRLFSGGLAPSPTAWTGGSGRAARPGVSGSATRGKPGWRRPVPGTSPPSNRPKRQQGSVG